MKGRIMDWDSHILFEINDLYDYEPEMLTELSHIDRRNAVKNELISRLRRHFRGRDEDFIDDISNPEVLREPAILLNLQMVFFANSNGRGVYFDKAKAYNERFEDALRRAFDTIKFDGEESEGVTLVR